jgi:peptidoglycan/xylan/chitin deacetylase (PgdA/CDA1 family)
MNNKKIKIIFLFLIVILPSFSVINTDFRGLHNGYVSYLKKIPGDVLKDFVFKAKTKEKIVALTFDDGPLKNTPKVVNFLKQNNLPATFFLVANKINQHNVTYYRDPLFSVGLHTKNHDDYRKLNYKQKLNDIENSIKIFNKYKLEANHFRPAYGIIDKDIRNILEQNNMKGIIWSLDSQDWNGYKKNILINQISNNLTSGDIILFHDQVSISDLRNVVKIIKTKGYKVVSLKKILSYDSDYPK